MRWRPEGGVGGGEGWVRAWAAAAVFWRLDGGGRTVAMVVGGRVCCVCAWDISMILLWNFFK